MENSNDETSKDRPNDSKIRQQKLPAWQPILTARSVIPIIFATGLIFIPIGVFLAISSESVKEYTGYYDCKTSDPNCNLTIYLAEDYVGDVYFYYALENYFQNNRRYMKSRSDKQLLGDLLANDRSDCAPYINATDVDGKIKPIAPCGVIANSMFNDTFTLYYTEDSQKTQVIWTYSGLLWEVDTKVKFKNPISSVGGDLCSAFQEKNTIKPPNWQKHPCELDVANADNNGFLNADFIIWMRVAALPNFRKPYRKLVRQDRFANGLLRGYYLLEIQSNYPVDKFSGKKAFIISTASWLGGKNNFMGIMYIIVGSICTALGLSFIIIHIKFGHRLSEFAGGNFDNHY